MITLFDAMTQWRERQRRKHDLADDRTETDINELSNYEFLQELSEALEEVLSERGQS